MPDREKTIAVLELMLAMGPTSFSETEKEAIRAAVELLKEQQQRIEQLEIDRDILVKDINTNNCNTCKRECDVYFLDNPCVHRFLGKM